MNSKTTLLAMMVACALLAVATGAGMVWAQEKLVDLNGDGTAESSVKLAVSGSFPVKVTNTVTNRAIGGVFTFKWPSAGPGGFSSSAGSAPDKVGSAAGVGATWTWQTNKTIYSFSGTTCANDICFTRTYGTGPASAGPFRVPGRTLTAGSVTVSNASLTSSLISFFSPPQELVRVTSTVEQLTTGEFRYTTQVENLSAAPINLDTAPGPLGCGSECGEGETECFFECPYEVCVECVDTYTDPYNCGECGNACPEGWGCYARQCYEPPSLVAGPAPRSPRQLLPCTYPGIPGATLQLGEVYTSCEVSQCAPAEVASQLTLCGDDLPTGPEFCATGNVAASRGTINVFAPSSPCVLPGSALPSLVDIVVLADSNGDGLIQPGETASLAVSLRNAGTANLTGSQVPPIMPLTGTLTSPPIDLTDDGIDNPESVSILADASAYPDLVGTGPTSTGATCASGVPGSPNSGQNVSPFIVSIPADHSISVSRPFNLHLVGMAGGSAFAADVPFNLLISSPIGPPLLVTLRSFTATPGDGQVTLRWETAAEIDNEGFNLYRRMGTAAWQKINPGLIPAQGDPVTGASYEYVDRGLPSGTTYEYMLEDVDTSGKTTEHGPVQATIAAVGPAIQLLAPPTDAQVALRGSITFRWDAAGPGRETVLVSADPGFPAGATLAVAARQNQHFLEVPAARILKLTGPLASPKPVYWQVVRKQTNTIQELRSAVGRFIARADGPGTKPVSHHGRH